MPLVKRAVEPSALCRQSLPKNIGSELECVTNNTLSGVILQLSSLSVHAEDLFGELFTEANSFYSRASKLQDRIDNLSVKVTQLDSSIEEVSLHDINMRKAFRSSYITDQQVVSRESLSKTLRQTYSKADKPPPLQDLNQFRDDGRDALKIYTDPDYFFKLWRDAMQKEMRDAKEKRREQRKKDKKANPNPRSATKVKAAVAHRRLKAERMQRGEELADLTITSNHVTAVPKHNQASIKSNHAPSPPIASPASTPDSRQVPNIQPPTPPPVAYPSHQTDLPAPPPPPLDVSGGTPDLPLPNNIPPPPPPPSAVPPPPLAENMPPPPPVGNAPPPPPPPPPPVHIDEPSTANAGGLAGQLAGVTLKKSDDSNRPPPAVDSRGGLLQAIRVGFNLKKVEEREKTAAATSSDKNDVASILARRIAVEFSDSESDSYTSDDGEWDD